METQVSDIALQIQKGLEPFVNWVLILAVGAVLEVVKVFLPDNIENRILPLVSISIGILISVFLLGLGTNGISVGIVSGTIASGCYAFIIQVIKRIFGDGNGGKNGK